MDLLVPKRVLETQTRFRLLQLLGADRVGALQRDDHLGLGTLGCCQSRLLQSTGKNRDDHNSSINLLLLALQLFETFLVVVDVLHKCIDLVLDAVLLGEIPVCEFVPSVGLLGYLLI
jgi:hypothetical protein